MPARAGARPGGDGERRGHRGAARPDGRRGKPVVAAFTHRARIRPDFLEHAPTVVQTQGAVLLQNLGSELGLVLNPGSAYGFELSSEHVAAVLRDFRPAEPGELDADGSAGSAGE
ncbi:SseB family protein [Sinomonas atrocyanea]